MDEWLVMRHILHRTRQVDGEAGSLIGPQESICCNLHKNAPFPSSVGDSVIVKVIDIWVCIAT